MNFDLDVQKELGAVGIQFIVRSGEAQFNCPFCGDGERKGSMNLVTGLWKCYHANRCGRQGNFHQFLQGLGKEPPDKRGEQAYTAPTAAPPKFGQAVVEHFQACGITEETLRKFDIGEKNGCIAFPHYRDRKLVNIKYRGLADKSFSQEKGAKPLLYNFDRVNPESRELYLVEGEKDVMALTQAGVYNVVSVPNGATSLTWIDLDFENLERFDRIYLCLDADTAGDEGSTKIAERLGSWRCYRVRPPEPYNDWTDMLAAGVLE